MTEQHDIVTVVIPDGENWRLGTSLDTDTGMTLIAVASRDPSCWEDMLGYWSRYRTPVACKFIDSLPMECHQAECEAARETEPDEFALAWSGHVSDEPIPGDTRGPLRLAFLLTEIVSALESLNAPRTDIRRLNANFTDFRTCGAAERAESGRRLGDHLDSLAERYSNLVPRVADFRSRIDERVRSLAIEDGMESPF